MQLPGPFRAAVGLIVTAADEAKRLPNRAIELPVLAVSTAVQASLRAQQRYARLTARGDEALARRPSGDEPPPWATFDEPVPAADLRAPLTGHTSDDEHDARRVLDDMFGSATAAALDERVEEASVTTTGSTESTESIQSTTPTAPAASTAAKAATAKTTAAARKTAAAKKTAAKKAAAARKAAAQKAAAKSATKTAGRTAAKTAAKATGKSVSTPRHTAPSRFDTVDVPEPDDEPTGGSSNGSSSTPGD